MKNIFKKFVTTTLVGISIFSIFPKIKAETDIKNLNNFFVSFSNAMNEKLKCDYENPNQTIAEREFCIEAIRLIKSAYNDINKNTYIIRKEYKNNSDVINDYIIQPLKELNKSVFYRCFDIPEKVLLLNSVYESENIKPIISFGIDSNNECLCLVKDSNTNKIILKSYNIG